MKKIYSILMYGMLLLILGFTQQISAQKTFVHPGIPFTQSDLDQLRVNITKEPWLTGYNALKNDSKSKLTYTMAGPFATVTRAPDLNNGAWKNDMVAIHNLTFMYVFTGDVAYAAKATQILDAWAVTNTTWGGGENMLDIGDHAPYFITAADILKSTYPGWTAANTAHVNNYFANVLYPASWVPNPLRDCNKGAIQLQIALGIAAFLDDETKWNQAIEVYRMDAGGGLRNSIPSGQVGDSGRDDHWFGQAWALTWDAEVAHKQGVDMFAEMSNRLYAIGELYNHYAIDPTGLTFTPYGGYSTYHTSGWGIATGSRKQHPFNNIIQAAYSLRKGIPTPYTSQMQTLVGEGAWSFLYRKSADTSTSTPMAPIVYPSENAVPSTYFSNMDIGITGFKGSTSYNAGIWTAKGAGTAASNSNNFTYKPIKGDVAIVAKIENNSISNAVSGLMIRESLETNSKFVSINFNSPGTINISGNGHTAANAGYTHYSTSSSWWLKLERVGNRVFAYHSADSVTWTNIGLFIIPLPVDAYIGFYTASKNTTALNTATFSNVAINNTFAVGSPEINNATSANVAVGTPFNFTITATGTPTTYAAIGLPAGLSIDTTTGVISGIPTIIGKNVVLLQATNTNGTGNSSLVIDVISNQPPVAITSLAATSASSTIKLTWTATTDATSYTVKRSLTAGGPYTTIQTGITGTTFIDPTPAYEVNNYYVVTALIDENESTVSNEVFGSVPPAVPTNIAAVSSNSQVDLNWNSADGAATYKIKRATTSGGPYTEIASVSTNAYTDTNVSNGTAYYYVVTSKGTTLESTISSEVFGNPGTNGSIWNANPTTNSFNVATNWTENTVPVSPAILTFKNSETSTLTNDITGLTASRIQFADDAVNYTIGGNNITLKSDLINNSSQVQTLTTPIVLDGQLNVNAKTNSIELSGAVSGTGSLLKTGTSALVMSGANTYSGNTIIRGTRGYAWGSTDGIQVMGIGTGTSGVPTSGPLGAGKIIMEGGALYTGLNTTAATLYNDIEVIAPQTGYLYERQGALNLHGRLLGNGTFINDGSDNYASISLNANNSGFTGTFVTKLRSGNHRLVFSVPQSGSANAIWNLDAVGADCHRIAFSTGTIEFGALLGRGGMRCLTGTTAIIRVGALNLNTDFSGTIANAGGTISLEKVGTATQKISGNNTFTGTTTILDGTLLIGNSSTTGTYNSPIIAQKGTLSGGGRTTSTVTIGTGSGTGANMSPGTDGTIGTFTTTGQITMNADASYKIDINNSEATSDKVITAKTVLNQAKLVLNNIVLGDLAVGTKLTIIDNTGSEAVAGTFKNLPEMSVITIGDHSFRITYVGGTGNDIQLLDDRGTYANDFLTGIYYIKTPGTNSFLTKNTTGNNPTFESATTDKNLQRWKLTKEGNGRYKITSNGGAPTGYNNYINENARFGSETYDATVNTMNIYRKGIYSAIEKPTGDGYWHIDNNSIVIEQNSIAGHPSAFPFELVYDIYYLLEIKLEEARNLRDAAQTSTTPVAGKYPVAAKETFSNVIAATEAHYNTLITAEQVNAEIAILNNAINDFKKTVYYNTNQLANGTYYIKVPNSELLWTKNTTNSPTFEAVNSDKNLQKFTITKQPNGYYKIISASGSPSPYQNYINENAQFGTNTYDATWNTMNIYFNGTTYAIQKTQKSGNGYWAISGNKIVGQTAATSVPPSSFPIELVLVGGQQTITFNALPTKTIGDSDFYPQANVTSNLPLNFTSSNTSVATIVDNKIHLVSPGIAIITAVQNGNQIYEAAPAVTQQLTVNKVFYVDTDHDGYGSTATALFPVYEAPEGYATNNTDCNDNDATVHQPIQYYVDTDKDGYGSTTTATLCSSVAPEGYATNNTDCNDSDATVHQPIQYYVDADKDGFGSTATTILCSSVAPQGYATNNSDCNDSDATVHQPIQYYVDADKDGFGSNVTAMLCSSVAPQGYATNNTDCNDNDAAIHEPVLYYVDADKDGFGSNVTAMLCSSTATEGYATNNNDCDDTNAIQLTATIPNVYALNNATDEKNTIYVGYGSTSLNISATPSGGTAPYTYQWSTNQTAKTIAVSAAGTYTVTVTDFKGCQTSASIVINTLNVQCGNSGDKVMICHNGQEICVSSNSVQSHLNHGDKLGSCSYMTNKDSAKILSEENTAEEVTVYPNPVSSLLNVKVSEVHSGATLELYNSLGIKVLSQTLKSTSEVMYLDRLPTGMYFLNINNGTEITVKKIIKE